MQPWIHGACAMQALDLWPHANKFVSSMAGSLHALAAADDAVLLAAGLPLGEQAAATEHPPIVAQT